LFDFKYDGFRGFCYLEQGRCHFISRNGNVLSRLDALADQVGRGLDLDEAIIDGEVIATDETGRPQFYELLRVPRSARYVAFDNRLSAIAAQRNVDGGSRAFCRSDRRSFPRRYPSSAGDASSSS
jgi:hypothetical protein